jgi:hypothetical protein
MSDPRGIKNGVKKKSKAEPVLSLERHESSIREGPVSFQPNFTGWALLMFALNFHCLTN